MIDQLLTQKHVSFRIKLTVKAMISCGLVILALFLPQLVHLALGAPGGVRWLPMYLPVLIGGCLLGTKWGVCVGIAAPIISHLATGMPAMERLPFMTAELAVFAVIAGLFSKKIAQNALWSFPAVVTAELGGRLSFLLLTVIFQNISSLKPAVVLQQLAAGYGGLVLQAMIVPLIILLLSRLLHGASENE